MLTYRILRVGKTDVFYSQNAYLARTFVKIPLDPNLVNIFIEGEYMGHVKFIEDLKDEDGRVIFEKDDSIFFASVFLKFDKRQN